MTTVRPPGLAAEDFRFDGPLGSDGAVIHRIGHNHFKVTLGHAPGHPEWANMLQFTIPRHARGNAPRLDVFFYGGNGMRFNTYFHSWSYDAKNWRPVHWLKGFHKESQSSRGDTLLFPEFEEDAVYFGVQVPMSSEDVVELLGAWQRSPHARVLTIGESLGGRPIHRLEITARDGPVARPHRRVHYFANQHPLEYNARWRMAGMIEWLLTDEAAPFRDANICQFVLVMSPDSPSKGWYRVNAAGIDMNRSYRAEGADEKTQTREAFLCQRDLQSIAASRRLCTVWAMHTCIGEVFPVLFPGPDVGTALGPWTELRDAIARWDARGLCAPLRTSEPRDIVGTGCWTYGPHVQFGVSAFLGEGGGTIFTRDDNMDSGRALIRGLADYCLRSRP